MTAPLTPVPLTLPRAVLYDWDNTLVTNWDTVREALNHALSSFGLPTWSAEEARSRIKQSLRDSFPRIFGERWTEARDLFYGYFADHHLDGLRPLPGAEALLRHFHERGVYQAVVSNKNGAFLRAEADALGWTGYFGRLVGAQDAAFDKPHDAPVRMALEPAGLEPGAGIWFLGDADIDMECAHGAGLVPVLIGLGEGSGFDRFPPAHRHADCLALHSVVYGLVDGDGDTISLQTVVETVPTRTKPSP